MEEREEKYRNLLENLKRMRSVAVAFSAGVDSTLLLWAAREAVGERAVAITAASRVVPEREEREAADFCRKYGVKQVVLRFEELSVPGFRENPPNRCYLCKQALFAQMIEAARAQGCETLAEGSNADDAGDYRPGMAAVRELGVKSPLLDAGLTKAEIRALLKDRGLRVWDKPSFACLASRFAYGQPISAEKLDRVGRAEELLRELAFRQFRVRVHGNLARIEVLPEDIPRLAEERESVYGALKELGFDYVTLDLGGYRSGSMNETLSKAADDSGSG